MIKSVEKLDKDKWCVSIDSSKSNGLLHFTKEITIWIDHGDFVCADVLSSGGWFDYQDDEFHSFEREYPGVFEQALDAVNKQKGDN